MSISGKDFPGVSVEATDMRAVAKANGLLLHQAPILNSPVLAKIPWRFPITVSGRIESPVTGQNSQVWYKVTYGSLEGWVAVRLEYNYADGVTGIVDPCSNTFSPNSLNFTYDREAAARFAIAQSYENDVDPIPNNEYRVSRRLTSIPFANFKYSDLGGAGESTGSALFVSESIWMGGMPMTVGDPNSCSIVQYIQAGWRFCWVPSANGGGSSTPWEVHKGLGEYYTTATFPPGFAGSNDILDPSGSQIMFTGTQSPDRLTAEDVNDFIGPVIDGGVGFDIDEEGLSIFSITHLGSLQAGDYVWLNSYSSEVEGSSYHGLFVLGWKLPVDCATAINNTYPATDFFVTHTLANDTPVVPWVADFTNPEITQRMVPRPFYCTRYDEDENSETGFVIHDWFFYTFLDSVTIPLIQLFVDPDWQWNTSDG